MCLKSRRSDTQMVLSFFFLALPWMWRLDECALSPLPNYPSSRWPRKWADILFMRRKIHFAEPSRDQVAPAQTLTLDNCPSFKFHLIWIFQNQTPFCRVFLGYDCWVWWMFRSAECWRGTHWDRVTLLEVNRQQWRHKSGVQSSFSLWK